MHGFEYIFKDGWKYKVFLCLVKVEFMLKGYFICSWQHCMVHSYIKQETLIISIMFAVFSCIVVLRASKNISFIQDNVIIYRFQVFNRNKTLTSQTIDCITDKQK